MTDVSTSFNSPSSENISNTIRMNKNQLSLNINSPFFALFYVMRNNSTKFMLVGFFFVFYNIVSGGCYGYFIGYSYTRKN